MLRRFGFALWLGWLMTMGSACWADLGPINVSSRLGQPFSATVALNGQGLRDLTHARIGLASQAVFDDYNVIRQPELAYLRFTLKNGINGSYILIHSSAPIQNPYLQFVLEVNTSSGRWVRPYDIKLESRGEQDVIDIPVATATPAPAVASTTKPRHKQADHPQAHGRVHAKTLAEVGARQRKIVPSVRLAAVASAPVSPAATKPAPPPPPSPEKLLASHPQSAAQLLSASQAAQLSASAAAASREIRQLQQQMSSRQSDLQKAKQHIVDLNLQIKAMQATQAQAVKQAQHLSVKNPWVIACAGGAVVLLLLIGGWLGYRSRARKGAPARESVPLSSTGVSRAEHSAEQADSQLDPLAEAEVHLAHGHEEKAESVLLKALGQHPARQDIRFKLLEIYAALPDSLRFEPLAREVYDAYDGRGAMWERVRAMGQALDPDNGLYRPGEGASNAVGSEGALDFSMLEVPQAEDPAAKQPTAQLEATPEPASQAALLAGADSMLDFDFSMEQPDVTIEVPAQVQVAQSRPATEEPMPVSAVESAIDWPADEPEAMTANTMMDQPEAVAEALPEPEPPIEQPLATELETAQENHPSDVEVEEVSVARTKADEELATKLDLAQVYLDMGDSEGAREVLTELASEARGTLKQRAEAMLAGLG